MSDNESDTDFSDYIEDIDVDIESDSSLNDHSSDSDSDTNDEDTSLTDDALNEIIDGENSIEIKVVNPNKRVTSNIMTEAELTQIICIRMKQIQEGSRVFTDVEGLTTTRERAIKELKDKKCPLMLERKVGSGTAVEYWDVNMMGNPSYVKLTI